MLKINNVSSGYGEVTVIDNLNVEIGHEVFAVLGANGVGKSTLMKTIARILPLKSGSIIFKGEDISRLTPYQVAAKDLAYVPQEELIFPNLTVSENLTIGGLLIGKKRIKKKMEEVYGVFPDIYPRRDQRAGSLSGGEAQMLAVGRALMQEPELILLDEPTAGLSPKNVDIFFKKVEEIRKTKNVSVVISEQNAVKALAIADRVMVLSVGKVFLIDEAKNVSMDKLKEGYRI